MATGLRREFEAEYDLAFAAEQVFPLLCPVREYDWIEGWQCELVQSVSGLVERDCVFVTAFPGLGREVWHTTRHEPSRLVEFVRVGVHCSLRYSIELRPAGAGTRMTVRQAWVALDSEGEKLVRALPPNQVQLHWDFLSRALAHYLATGNMLALA